MLYALGEKHPQLGGNNFIAPNAALIGDVILGHEASVWFNAVLRGDNEPVTVGDRSNVQDNCVLHTDPGYPLVLDKDVTVGHMCMLHGCQVERGALIGINSVILNGAKIGEYCIVGANSLIAENKEIPPRSLVVGSPGRVVKTLSDEQIEKLADASLSYVKKIAWYNSAFQEYQHE